MPAPSIHAATGKQVADYQARAGSPVFTAEERARALAAGEYAENIVRKDFTPSERVAIAYAVTQELGNRTGRPAKGQEIPPQVADNSGRETRDIAAERAGRPRTRSRSTSCARTTRSPNARCTQRRPRERTAWVRPQIRPIDHQIW